MSVKVYMDNYNYSFEDNSEYCYSGTTVLVNKLNIKDAEILDEYERKLVSFRQVEMKDNSVQGNLDFTHFKEIHKYLFQDVCTWAGKIRTFNISKTATFCLMENINSYAEEIFEKLKDDNYYVDLDIKNTLLRLIELFGDLNALHCFREGNGRNQRLFIEILANVNGISFDFSTITKEEMIEASYKSILGDNTLLQEIFKENFMEITSTSRIQCIEKYIKSDKIKNIFYTVMELDYARIIKR